MVPRQGNVRIIASMLRLLVPSLLPLPRVELCLGRREMRIDHGLVLDIIVDELHEHPPRHPRGVVVRSQEVLREHHQEVAQLGRLADTLLPVGHTGLLAYLLDRRLAAPAMQRMHQLNAQGLYLLPHKAGLLDAVRQHGLPLDPCVDLVRIEERCLRTRLQPHRNTGAALDGIWHQLEDIRMLPNDVDQLFVLEAGQPLELGDLVVIPDLCNNDTGTGIARGVLYGVEHGQSHLFLLSLILQLLLCDLGSPDNVHPTQPWVPHRRPRMG
mmetsp:Transcript_11603/g.24495  ORF Transcript_11603/g.24495 Transcript_11603/m.24495 type:complete len:269 (-) Transcript_11603:713-1519(-)